MPSDWVLLESNRYTGANDGQVVMDGGWPSTEYNTMPKLKVTITNEAGAITGEYVIVCVDRPGLDTDSYDTAYTINLIRAASERHEYLRDFSSLQALSQMSITYSGNDPGRIAHLKNVNELWFEIENLLSGARLNLATARILKDLEEGYSRPTDFDVNARFDLHLEKMERFHLGVYELARVEDLIVRLLYEYFGKGFIETDVSKPGWEKRLTWDAMKDALNKRSQPDNAHPAVVAMDDRHYDRLMKLVRGYRSAEVTRLMQYRNARTHRVTPSVDHPELSVDMLPPLQARATAAQSLFVSPNGPAHKFLDLYSDAKHMYTQLVALLADLNVIIHA
jgi:hypothetical protein